MRFSVGSRSSAHELLMRCARQKGCPGHSLIPRQLARMRVAARAAQSSSPPPVALKRCSREPGRCQHCDAAARDVLAARPGCRLLLESLGPEVHCLQPRNAPPRGCATDTARVQSHASQGVPGQEQIGPGVKREAGARSPEECNSGAAHATVSEPETAICHWAHPHGKARSTEAQGPARKPGDRPGDQLGGSRWAMPDRLRYLEHRNSLASPPLSLSDGPDRA